MIRSTSLSLVLGVAGALASLTGGAAAQYVSVTVKDSLGVTIPIQVSRTDYWGAKDGKTTFKRVYPARSSYTLTAPLTHQDVRLLKFHHWELRDSPTGNYLKKPVGQNVLNVYSIGTEDDVAVAHYILETTISVRSIGASAVPITLSQADAWGDKDGSTQFFRKFAWNTKGVQFTAPASFGGKQFHHWTINVTAQPAGQRTITMDIGMNYTTVTAYYGTHTPGKFEAVGQGCLGTSGKNLWQSPSSTLPEIGNKIEYRVLYAPKNSVATMAFGIPLPTAIQLPGTPCWVYASPVAMLSANVTSTGYARIPVTIPNDKKLIGAWIYTQFLCLDPGANTLGLTTSGAVKTTVGGWKF